MDYITKPFHKIIKNHEGFQKKSFTNRTATANDLRHTCDKPVHFIRDCPGKNKNLMKPDFIRRTWSQTMFEGRLILICW